MFHAAVGVNIALIAIVITQVIQGNRLVATLFAAVVAITLVMTLLYADYARRRPRVIKETTENHYHQETIVIHRGAYFVSRIPMEEQQ